MSPRFSPLEAAVLDALAWELREIAPDLAGQFADSLPGQRRNTGSGLFTELIVDRTRPPPLTTPTGRFGSVHAMVGDLPDPIAFQAELRAGRLLYLFGDAYGQDTRDIDFVAAPFDQVFTIDARGESVAFDPVALMPPSPLLDLHTWADPAPPTPIEPRIVNTSALQRVQDASPPDPLAKLLPPGARAAAPGEKQESLTSLLIGVWAAIAAVALIATFLFRLPLIFAVVLTVIAGRWVRKPAVLSAIQGVVETWGNREFKPPRT